MQTLLLAFYGLAGKIMVKSALLLDLRKAPDQSTKKPPGRPAV
jgi:hypothetical protein